MKLILLISLINIAWFRASTKSNIQKFKKEVALQKLDCNWLCKHLAELGALKLYLHLSVRTKDQQKKILTECQNQKTEYKSRDVREDHLTCTNGNNMCVFRDDYFSSENKKGQTCFLVTEEMRKNKQEQLELAKILALESKNNEGGEDDSDDDRPPSHGS
jgi:hypothetical protein